MNDDRHEAEQLERRPRRGRADGVRDSSDHAPHHMLCCRRGPAGHGTATAITRPASARGRRRTPHRGWTSTPTSTWTADRSRKASARRGGRESDRSTPRRASGRARRRAAVARPDIGEPDLPAMPGTRRRAGSRASVASGDLDRRSGPDSSRRLSRTSGDAPPARRAAGLLPAPRPPPPPSAVAADHADLARRTRAAPGHHAGSVTAGGRGRSWPARACGRGRAARSETTGAGASWRDACRAAPRRRGTPC